MSGSHRKWYYRWGQVKSVNVIGGHYLNSTSNGVTGATIGGGGLIIREEYEGEWEETPHPNRVTDHLGTVSGGAGNAAGALSTVGGGVGNLAGLASLGYCTVGGGGGNTASGDFATVGGGLDNTASGDCSVVPGGCGVSALGAHSFAAGRGATALHDGAFVWADASSEQEFSSTRENDFRVRATGGAVICSALDDAGEPAAAVTLEPGAGAWATLSTRQAKDNFATVDTRAVLAELAVLPLATWNYKTQDPSIRHIGPTAEDFHAAFGVGHDEKHIGTVDADGVALAAIQGLYEIVQEKDAEIAALRARLERLESLVSDSHSEREGGAR